MARKGKLPCAFGTHGTQEAGTRSPYVHYGCPTDAPRLKCQPRPGCESTLMLSICWAKACRRRTGAIAIRRGYVRQARAYRADTTLQSGQ